jgi:hypothetical protein
VKKLKLPGDLGFKMSYSLTNGKKRIGKTRRNGNPVTKEQRRQRANEIANQLCKHSLWNTHDHGITREIAWEVCKLKITL